MADIKSFPNNQDVYIGAEQVMKWLHGRTSGVFGAGENAVVTAIQNSMSVEVSDGIGWMSNEERDGVVWWNDFEKENGQKLRFVLDISDGTYDRIDRIVVSWQTTNYVAFPTISVLKGVSSRNPSPPNLTNNSTMRQISLAQVRIPAGSISISPSMILDERLDPSVCGIVTESVSIDTSVMNAQFRELLTSVEEELSGLNSGTEVLLKSGGVQIPVKPDQAANKEYVDTNFRPNTWLPTPEEIGSFCSIVWENKSLSSSFNGQTIELDLSKYNFIFVSFLAKTGSTGYVSSGFIPIADDNRYSFSFPADSGAQFKRSCIANVDNVNFGQGSQNGNLDNTLMVPAKIYGVI